MVGDFAAVGVYHSVIGSLGFLILNPYNTLHAATIKLVKLDPAVAQ